MNNCIFRGAVFDINSVMDTALYHAYEHGWKPMTKTSFSPSSNGRVMCVIDKRFSSSGSCIHKDTGDKKMVVI